METNITVSEGRKKVVKAVKAYAIDASGRLAINKHDSGYAVTHTASGYSIVVCPYLRVARAVMKAIYEDSFLLCIFGQANVKAVVSDVKQYYGKNFAVFCQYARFADTPDKLIKLVRI